MGHSHDDDARATRDVAPAQFVPLRSVSALRELVERSDLEPLVVLQHDPYCPISRGAYRQVASAPIQAALVDADERVHESEPECGAACGRRASPSQTSSESANPLSWLRALWDQQ
jgi:hypothetical protein